MKKYLTTIGSALGLLLVGVAALTFALCGTKTITGTPVANHDQVVAVHQEQADADAKAQAQAAADLLSREEASTLQSVQAFLADPANDWTADNIVVSKVELIASTGNEFEGTATMAAGDRAPRDIPIHVVDDGHDAMWSIAPGAMLDLFK